MQKHKASIENIAVVLMILAGLWFSFAPTKYVDMKTGDCEGAKSWSQAQLSCDQVKSWGPFTHTEEVIVQR